MNKPYPIGTKIKYIGGCHKCKGKTGKVIRIYERTCSVTLPQSKCSTLCYNGTLTVSWCDVELLPQKNVQLEFAFMEDTDA